MTTLEISKIIKRSFDQYLEVPLKEWSFLAQSGCIKTIKKETIIKKANKTEKSLNLIISGSVCILIWNENNFICTDLLFDDEFAFDYLSFLTQKPTLYEVRTMEDTEIFTTSYSDFVNFTAQSSYGDKIWRYATQALYIDKHYQQLQLLTMTATQRYKLALDHQGNLMQRIPQKYIASYLGITQQSLSRMRSNKK
ncbi:Crp/Fnr family transcriptional regulator [Niastella caeni]|uniref:Crp/Fnr family transcriptional regulator n=1 Tax=Niastella caeni TaxID=2569763 RepID=A0A4S8HS04_9BACT|nr:cyclic nucleotide-binding domain-containing protein [Niastella caeni]THU38307.1 Crp/Fnr family transcriptional regulator [Niastella caeni]